MNFARHRYQYLVLVFSFLPGACSTIQVELAETTAPLDQSIAAIDTPQTTPEVANINQPDTQRIFIEDYFVTPWPYPPMENPPSVVSTLPRPDDIDDKPSLNLAIKMAQTRESLVLQRREAGLLALAEIEKNNDAWYRLQQGMQFTPVLNDRVNAQLNWYLNNRGYLERVMQRARLVLPFILDELEKNNLPTELALLPIVESAYQTFAYSHGRASGMWQIIPSTGRFLGVKQNWWYDGRRDIIESTRAAIRYLKSLSDQFNGDWDLALASYNAGPGKIRNAVRYNRKRNRQTDFWNLTRIRKETKNYLPKLYALKELFGNPERYQLELLPIRNEPFLVIVELDQQIDLALAAELAELTISELYQYNPGFNRWATSPNGPHRLLLPKDKSEQFKQALNEIPAEKHINWVRHKIRSGETLSEIARKYRTTTALIKSVNKIRGTQIRAGKYLTIPTATKSLKSYTLSKTARLSKIKNTRRSGDKQIHLVRTGESLWSISRRYGVSTKALARWNGMAPIDTLNVGQKLTIWTKKESLERSVASLTETGPNQGLYALKYTIRKGDSLYRIATRFNIRVSDIRRWNKIGRYLQPGQKIKLYVDITKQSG